MVTILVILTIAIFLVIDVFVRRRQLAYQPARVFASSFVREALQKVWMGHPALTPADFRPRPDRYYDPGHTFVELEPDGTVAIGVDRFVREMMADFRLVGLVTPGQTVSRGQPIAELRSNGRTARVLSPIDGVVTHLHPAIPDEGVEPPLYTIAPQNLSEHLNRMSVGEQTLMWLKGEIVKLQGVAAQLMPKPALVGATSADGGLARDPLVSECDEAQFTKIKNTFGLM